MTTESTRKTGIRTVGDVPWGTHFCHFYQTRQDLYKTVIPYLKAGLEGHEMGLWVISESSSQKAMNALRRAIPDLDRHLSAGEIEILLSSEWYFEDEAFDPQQVIHAWNAKLAQALAKGYAGLRMATDVAWLEKKDWKVFSEYEKKLDQTIATQPMIALCACPLATSEASVVFEVTRTHQFAIARRYGRWEVLETPELKKTKAELKELNAKLDQMVAERTEELETSNEALRHEIAGRKRAEEALRETEAKYRTLVEQVPAVTYIGAVDQAGNTLYISPQIEQMLGFAADEWTKDPDLWAKQLHPDDRERVLAEVANSHASGEPLRFEYRLMARDDHTVWVRDEAVIVRDEAGHPLVLQGIMLDITQRKQVEEERQTHLWFLESMDRVYQAMQRTNDLEQMMRDVLDTVLSIFDCDRAYLLYPCDPEAASWTSPMERTKPEYPGVLALGLEVPTDKDVAETFRILRNSAHPVKFGPGTKHPLPPEVAVQFGIKSFMSTALYPKVGEPWQFGIHQCSYPRTWTAEEERLLQGIGHRLTDALTSLLTYRNLQESELRYRELFENSSECIFLLDVTEDGRFKFAEFNPTQERVVGFSNAEVSGKFVEEAIPAELAQQVTANYRRCVEAGTMIDYDEELDLPVGRRDFHTNLIPVHNAVGDIYRIIGIARDITQSKRAEADLRKLSQAVEQSPASIIITDAAGDIEYVNPKFTEVTGFTREEALGENPRILKSGETPPEEYRQLWETIIHGDVWHGEFHNKKKNGELYWESASISPVYDSQGNIKNYVAVKEDITERKRAEEALRDSEAHYRAIVEAFDGLICICSQDYHIEFMNTKLIERTGYDGTGKLCYEILHDYDTVCPWCVNEGVFQGETARWEIQSPKDDRWYYVVNTPIFRADGSISKQAMIQDITERKHRERMLEALVTVAKALRAALRRDEVLRIVSDQVFDLLGIGGVALLLRNLDTDELVVMAARGAWKHWIDVRLPSGEGISGHVVATSQPFISDDVRTAALLSRPNLIGDLHSVVCVPLIAKGEVIGVLWVGQQAPVGLQDVRLLKALADMAAMAIRRAILHEQTQRHAAELEERVAERTRDLAEANMRLRELDQLKTRFVSDVSHELRTPITNLTLYLDLLINGKPEKSEHYMTVLKQQADRLKQLIEDILDLSRLDLGGGEIAFSQVDLNQLVDQIVAAHQAVAENANLHLVFEPDPNLLLVRGEMNQLAQVVTNLVVNALNYTPAGSVQVRTYLEDDHACLDVEDTGTGIDPEDLPHLFERFYRGKGVSQWGVPGTGLGLAIVKEIVDLHKGNIEINSQQGRGTTFTVRLPLEE